MCFIIHKACHDRVRDFFRDSVVPQALDKNIVVDVIEGLANVGFGNGTWQGPLFALLQDATKALTNFHTLVAFTEAHRPLGEGGGPGVEQAHHAALKPLLDSGGQADGPPVREVLKIPILGDEADNNFGPFWDLTEVVQVI
jgi:hypothetical protein